MSDDTSDLRATLIAAVEERRRCALGAYRADSARVQTDANREHEIAERGYHGVQVRELLQNAIDGALDLDRRAGRVAVLFRRADRLLCVANDGVPFDDRGVVALCCGDQSPKRGRQIGRYGVGFRAIAAVADYVEVESAGARFHFDRDRAELEIRSVVEGSGTTLPERVPLLHVPFLTERSRFELTAEDDLRWAITRITIQLRDDARTEAVARELGAIDAKFLAFIDGDLRVLLDDDGDCREIVSRRDAHGVTIRDGGNSFDGLTTLREAIDVPLDRREELKRDNTIAYRDSVDLHWCYDAAMRQGRWGEAGSLWLVFPLGDESSPVPGLLNAPWRTDTARQKVLPDNAWNDWLAECASRMIARELVNLSTASDPGRHLDFAPPRDLKGGGFQRSLAARIDSELRGTAWIPDSAGILRRSVDLFLPPAGLPRELLERWEALVDSRNAPYVHSSVAGRDDRRGRLKRIERSETEEATLAEWVSCLRVEDADSSVRAVELLAGVVAGGHEDGHALSDSPVVLCEDGRVRTPRECFVPVDADPDYAREHRGKWAVDFAVRTRAEGALRALGVESLDTRSGPEATLARLRELVDAALQNEDSDERRRRVGEDASRELEALREFSDEEAAFIGAELRWLGGIPLRTVAGGWAWSCDLVDPELLEIDLHSSKAHGPGAGIDVAARALVADPDGLHRLPRSFVATLLSRNNGDTSAGVVGDHAARGSRVEDRSRTAQGARQREMPPQVIGRTLKYDRWMEQARARYKARNLEWRQSGDVVTCDESDFPLAVARTRRPGARAQERKRFLKFERQHDGIEYLRCQSSLHVPEAGAEIPEVPPFTWRAGEFRQHPQTVARLTQRALDWIAVTPRDRTFIGLRHNRKNRIDGAPREENTLYGDAFAVHPVLAEMLDSGLIELEGELVSLSDIWTLFRHERFDPNLGRQRFVAWLLHGVPSALPAMDALIGGWDLDPASRRGTSAELLARWCRDLGDLSSLEAGCVRALLSQRVASALDDPGAHFDWVLRALPLSTDLRFKVVDGSTVPLSELVLLGSEAEAPTDRRYLVVSDEARVRVEAFLASVGNPAEDGSESPVVESFADGDADDPESVTDLAADLRELDLVGKIERIMQGRVEELRAMLPGRFREVVRQDEMAALVADARGPELFREPALVAGLRALGFAVPKRWGDNGPTRAFCEQLGLSVGEFDTRRAQGKSQYDVNPSVYLELRGYQTRLVEGLAEVLAKPGARCMLSLPTGAGKTLVAMRALCDRLSAIGEPAACLWVAHQEELLEQARAQLDDAWQVWGDCTLPHPQRRALRVSRLSAGRRPAIDAGFRGPQVVLASIQTLVRRMQDDGDALDWLGRVAVVVFDEAHRALAPTYTTAIHRILAASHPAMVGLSATPYRGQDDESKWLRNRFGNRLLPGDSDTEAHFRSLQAAGVLSQYSLSGILEDYVVEFDLTPEEKDHLATYKDLPPTALERLGEAEDYTELIARRVAELPKDARVLVFCCSVHQAREVALLVALMSRREDRPRRTAFVDAKLSSAERRRRIDAFKRGEIHVLTSVSVLTTGFDAPEVDHVVIARPTTSKVLYLQMAGRGLRGPASGGTKHCTIINAEPNLARWGDVELPYEAALREWSEG